MTVGVVSVHVGPLAARSTVVIRQPVVEDHRRVYETFLFENVVVSLRCIT